MSSTVKSSFERVVVNSSGYGTARRVGDIVRKYDVGGEQETFGCKSNKTVINALKRFKEFVDR